MGDGIAPPLVGPRFRLQFDEQPFATIYMAVRAGDEQVSERDGADLTAYILQANGFLPSEPVVGRER